MGKIITFYELFIFVFLLIKNTKITIIFTIFIITYYMINGKNVHGPIYNLLCDKL